MQQSRSKYVELESISLTELFKLEPGAVGLYFPAKDEDGKVRQSLVRLASQAKSLATTSKKRCLLQTLMVIENSTEGDIPPPVRMLKVTVKSADEISPSGERYLAAQKRKPSAEA